ncbi:MAG: hypothetical protein IH897_06750, partial [Planctomycetes bacterium]|nr:hypothetical protein [Planctomycetota bacterium]
MTPDTLATLKICGIVILLAPLAGAVLAGGLAPILRGRAHWPTILGVGTAFVAAIYIFLHVRGFDSENVTALIPVYDWIANGTPSAFRVEFLIDPLTSIMLLIVTGVSLLVVIYSRDYMRENGQPERGYERFFAFLG